MKPLKMDIESEELLALAQAKFIAAQVAIKKFGWAHHMLLLGSKRMQKLGVIGIHLVGNHVIAGHQRSNELVMLQDTNY